MKNNLTVVKIPCKELAKDFQKLMEKTVCVTVSNGYITYWQMDLFKIDDETKKS